MKKVKKILALLLVAATAIVFSSCGNSSGKTTSTGSKQVTLGFAFQNLSNEYQVNMQKAAVAYAKSNNIKLLSADAQGDGAKEVSQVEGFISQRVDGIILAPQDKDACAPAVTESIAAGIPIVVVNAMTSNVDKATSFVGSDDSVAGTMEMDYIAKQLNGKGNIVILQGPTGNSATTNRLNGINSVLAKYPDIKVVGNQPANWDRALAMSTMENWMQSGKTIDAVVAENDEMALGALKATSAAGKSNIKIVGIDAISDGLKAVQDGTMCATVFQDAKQQATKAMQVVIQASKGQKVEKNYMIDFKLVTKDNVSQFMAS